MRTGICSCFNCNAAYINCYRTCPNSPAHKTTPSMVIYDEPKIPSGDFVEVVRCRDCIHNRDNGGDCDRTIILNEYDSTEYRCAGLEYCSYGERREE